MTGQAEPGAMQRHSDEQPQEGAQVFLRYKEDGRDLWAYPATYVKGTWYAHFRDGTDLVRPAQPDDDEWTEAD